MAICAICQLELRRDQGVALSGSEAFHKACVRTHGTANSVVNRLKAKLLEVEALAVRQRDELRAKLDATVADLKKTTHRRDELYDQVVSLRAIENQLELKKAELAKVRSELVSLRIDFRELEHEGDVLQDERDAARQEAALHQMLGKTVVSTPVVVPEPADDRDATEVRFSLLELDDLK